MKRISKMKLIKTPLVTLLLVASSLLLMGAKNKDDEGLKIGSKMPQPTKKMMGADGSEYSLAELMGENGLVVIFSCNTCPFVVGSDNFEGWEKQYNDLHQKAKTAKMGLVLVNSNEAKRAGDDSLEAMKSHSELAGYTMPYVVDKDAKLADAMGAKTTPHVFVYSGSTKLIYKGSIDNSWDTKKEKLETFLIDAMNAVSEGKEITNNSTTPRGCSIKRTK